MSIIPSPWPVVHIARRLNLTVEDDHGEHPVETLTPVVRRAMSYIQHGRNGSSHQVMSAEFVERTETTLGMTVADTTLYEPQDQVFIFPELNPDKTWQVNTGLAYWVDGVPTDERVGPWPGLLKIFGGTVKLRRVS